MKFNFSTSEFKNKIPKKIWTYFEFFLFISLFIAGIFFIFFPTAEAKTITIASGRLDGAYIKKASEICEKYRNDNNVNCKVIPTSGSIENIKLLKNNLVTNVIVQQDVMQNEKDYSGKFLEDNEALVIVAHNKVNSDNLHFILKLRTVIDNNSGVNITMNNIADALSEKLNIISNNVLDAESLLCSGEIDYLPIIMSLPSKKIELLLAKCNVHIVQISDFNIDTILEKKPMYFKYTHENGTYLGIRTLYL